MLDSTNKKKNNPLWKLRNIPLWYVVNAKFKKKRIIPIWNILPELTQE